MKLSWLVVGVCLLAAATLSAKEQRVGYIDSEAVIAKYEEAREAKRELESEVAEFKTAADSLRRQYQQALDEYESQELTLSEEGKRAKMTEVGQLKRRYDGYVDDIYRKGGKIDQKNDELIAPLVEKINEVVGTIAEEEGFALVLDASKSEIVFSDPGLDLTQLVIDELNREFAAVGPVGTDEIIYAILPIAATNDEARQDRVDFKVREFVYNLVRVQPKVEMVESGKVDKQLTERGIEVRTISGRDAVDVGTVLDVDYAIFGTCSKEDPRIEFTLTIVDVRMNNEDLKTETGRVSREANLNDEIARAVQSLLAAVDQP